jgi:hypothetical protein
LEEERGGDKAKAEEQPAVEPVAVGGEAAAKEGIAAIITDPVLDDARSPLI